MQGNIAVTYTLIHRFLKQQSQNKAAEAVKKAARPFVVLRDDMGHDGPPLEDIIKEWKTRAQPSSDTDSSSEGEPAFASPFVRRMHLDSSEDSSCSDPSSDESKDASGSGSEENNTSDSDDSSSSSEEDAIPKKQLPKSIERDTSATLSSDTEEARKATLIQKKLTVDGGKASKCSGSASPDSEASNSDSSSSSDSDTSDADSSSSGSSSSSDSSDEDEQVTRGHPPRNKMKPTQAQSQSTSESSSGSEGESDSDSEDIHATKKRKILETGAAMSISVATGSQQTAKASQKKEKLSPKIKKRFQRVKFQNLAPELLLNNGYEAGGAGANDYGERAHRDLIVTRGAGFRKEKNKKKRGSYRGGEITLENRSVKFDF